MTDIGAAQRATEEPIRYYAVNAALRRAKGAPDRMASSAGKWHRCAAYLHCDLVGGPCG